MTKRILTLLLALLCVTSCDWLDRLFHSKSDVVARVGTDILYRYEIDKLIPAGISSADSLRMIEQYVHSWAMNKLLLEKAEKSLPKGEKDITGEIETFRRDLLTFRYEKHFLEEKLDTLVTPDETKEWYDSHQSEFILPYSIIKTRLVRISPKSPYYMEIRELLTTVYGEELSSLEELCYTSSEKYTDFMKGWIPSSILASEMGITVSECEALLASNNFIEIDSGNAHYMFYVIDRVAPGSVTPLDYNIANIHDLIVSRRKQDLLVTLEQDLFKEAIANNKFKRYN